MDKLKKEHLQNVLEGWQVSTEGTVQQLRDRMKDIIKKRTSEDQKAKHDTKKVFLSQDVCTSSICSMTESIIVSASDTERHFYTIELTSDGVAMHGLVKELCSYPAECLQVLSMCVNNGTLFVSFKGKNEAEKQGELLSIDLTSRQSSFI